MRTMEEYSWMAPALWAASAMFGGAVRLRNRMDDSSLLPQKRLRQPVISIGNLTAGGSGKTPLAIHLGQTIHRLGGTPVLLSRGYGREQRSDIVLAPGNDLNDLSVSSEQLGDEPTLVRRRVTELWLGISANRYRVALAVSRRCADPVFILDDGYQHRKLARDLDMVVIDCTQPLAENHILPRGTLREPWENLGRADMIVILGPVG